jgi:hypothetical protein
MLGHDRGCVRMMMLDRNRRTPKFLGKTRRREIRVQVVRHGYRVDIENRQKMVDGLLKKTNALSCVEIADMLRDEGLAPACDRYRRLELAADGKHWGNFARELDRARHVAACTPNESWRAVGNRHDRIIRSRDNRSIVSDDKVRDAGKTTMCFLIVDHQRLAAGIGAGRH